MNIYESAEDYLEAILRLQQRKGSVRSIDIANELEQESLDQKTLRDSVKHPKTMSRLRKHDRNLFILRFTVFPSFL